jgi:hypothetical protein
MEAKAKTKEVKVSTLFFFYISFSSRILGTPFSFQRKGKGVRVIGGIQKCVQGRKTRPK